MLKTPIEHLPRYYEEGIPWAPEWEKTERAKYQPIWDRAFEIHAVECASAPDKRYGDRWCTYIINPIEESDATSPYCDCYERAYQEFKRAGKLQELGITLSEETPPDIVPATAS